MPAPTRVLGSHGRVIFLELRRKHPEFKAEAFARYLEVPKSHVSEVENGKRDPSLAFCEALARYLDDWDVVFGDVLARGGRALAPLVAAAPPHEERPKRHRASSIRSV